VDVHLRDLRYFVAVAEELHFTRAAQHLFVSQPALSRQISKLETDLRVTLLDRDRRQVRLTAAGQALLDGIRPMLTTWDETRRAASDAAATAGSILRVGIQTGIGRGVLATVSEALSRTHPNWTVTIIQVMWDDPSAGLADHGTDVALLWLPIPEPHSFRWVTIATEARLVALPVGHRLAKHHAGHTGGPRRRTLHRPARASRSSPLLLAGEGERTTIPIIANVAHSAEETFEAVAAGLGVALVSEGNAQLYKQHSVVCLPVTDIGPANLALAWRSDDHRDVLRGVMQAVESRP